MPAYDPPFWDAVAIILWTALAASAALGVWGLARRSGALLLAAGADIDA